MPFELIMLLGFFGAALLGLLPEASKDTAAGGFRLRLARQRRNPRGERQAARHGRREQSARTHREAAKPLRGGSRAAA
jgi:hypothetical protein